jgi:hypothetical protein
MGEKIGAYRVWWGNLADGKRSLGRYRRRWENNIKIDLREVGSGSGKEQMAGTSNGHSVSIKCGEFIDQLRIG